MINPAEILRNYLVVSATGLYTAVGVRIYQSYAPDNWTPTTSAVIFHLGGDEGDGHAPAVTQTVEFDCIPAGGEDASPADAWAIYQALHDRLFQATLQAVTGGTLIYATETVTGSDSRTEDGWPTVSAIWEIQVRATA